MNRMLLIIYDFITKDWFLLLKYDIQGPAHEQTYMHSSKDRLVVDITV